MLVSSFVYICNKFAIVNKYCLQRKIICKNIVSILILDFLHWEQDESGYYLHNISAVAEWICAACTTTYLTMFYWEFSKITLHEPDVFVEDVNTNTENLQRTVEILGDN